MNVEKTISELNARGRAFRFSTSARQITLDGGGNANVRELWADWINAVREVANRSVVTSSLAAAHMAVIDKMIEQAAGRVRDEFSFDILKHHLSEALEEARHEIVHGTRSTRHEDDLRS